MNKLKPIQHRAIKLDNQVKKLRIDVDKIVSVSLLQLGEWLKEIRDDRLHELLGSETFLSYLGGLHFSQSSGYNAIRIYERYSEKLQLSDKIITDIPQRRLVDMLPVITKKNKDEWLEKAKALSSSDLRIEINEARGKKPRGVRPRKCGYCGGWIIKENKLCHCDK